MKTDINCVLNFNIAPELFPLCDSWGVLIQFVFLENLKDFQLNKLLESNSGMLKICQSEQLKLLKLK